MPVTPPPPGLTEEDYDRIEAAVMETARGRWFLTEYARRIREGESQRLLEAVSRIERLVEETVRPHAAAQALAAPPPAAAAALQAPETGERAPSALMARIESFAREPVTPASVAAGIAFGRPEPAAPPPRVQPAPPAWQDRPRAPTGSAFAPLEALTMRERLEFFH